MVSSDDRVVPLCVLGPIALHVDGERVAVGGPIPRRLLAALLVNRNAVVSADRLVEVLWGDDPPDTAMPSLQTYASRLRRLLPASAHLETAAPGYCLRLSPGAADVDRFEAALAEGLELERLGSDPDAVLARLEAALAYWQGDCYAEFRDEWWAQAEAARLEELRLHTREARADALLALGRDEVAVSEARAITVDHPSRERAWRVLMVGLHRCGRQGEALRGAGQYRAQLREQSGLDPSREFAALEHAIVVDAPSLRVAARKRGAVCKILGPMRVVVDGRDVTPPSSEERSLLALLVVNAGRIVSADRLAEELWPELSSEIARRALEERVAAVRKALEVAGASSLLEDVPPGYRFGVEELDAAQFARAVEEGQGHLREGRYVEATASLREAFRLWDGDPLADAQGSAALREEAARLAELRIGAVEDRIDAELGDGYHRRLLPELDSLAATHPLRERLWAQRILALYRSGRQSDALQACRSVRQALADGLGVAPGPALRQLETAVREKRSELDWTVAPDPVVAASGRLTPLPTVDRPPEVHYVKSADGVNLAYQVAGDGPVDLIIVPGYITQLDTWWEAYSGRLVRRLASFCRLILFDKRGVGLSDRPARVDIEHWMEDIRTVLDAVGSERPVVFGVSAGGPTAILFAATYPTRTASLVLYGAFARRLRDGPDYPYGPTEEERARLIEDTERGWGTGVGFEQFCPSAGHDAALRANFGRYQRLSASPGASSTYLRMVGDIDVRHALPLVAAPTLVLHASRDQCVDIEVARYMTKRIPDATLVELDSADHLIWFSDAIDTMTDEIQDFITGAVPAEEINRRLLTIVCVEVGEDAVASRLERASRLLERSRGEHVNLTPTGIVAGFDGPARAVRAAAAVVAELRWSDIPARAGVHSGECESRGQSVDGVAVTIAHQVAALAQRGEVVVSQTVRDLVMGSSIEFEDRGSHPLQGAPGDFRVFSALRA